MAAAKSKAPSASESINLSADMASAATARSVSEKACAENARSTEILYGLLDKTAKLYAAEVDAHGKTHSEWASDTQKYEAAAREAAERAERRYTELERTAGEKITRLTTLLNDRDDRLKKIGITLS